MKKKIIIISAIVLAVGCFGVIYGVNRTAAGSKKSLEINGLSYVSVENGFTEYQNSEGLSFYYDSKGNIKAIINNGTYNNSGSIEENDFEKAMKDKLAEYTDIADKEDVISKYTVDSTDTHILELYQEGTGSMVASIYYDGNGNFVGANIYEDAYLYNSSTESDLSDEECISIARKYIEEHQMKGEDIEVKLDSFDFIYSDDTEFTVVNTIADNAQKKSVTILNDKAYDFEVGFSILIDVKTGEVESCSQIK